jgi:hypothetical protein
MKLSKTSIFHPFLFAIFPIISTYSINMQELLPHYLIQPIIIILVFSIIILFIFRLILKNWAKAGVMASLTIGYVFSYGHIYLQIAGFELNEIVIGRHIFLIVPYIITFFVIGIYIFRTKDHFENITKILNVVGITVILVSVVSISTYAIENNGLGIVILEEIEVSINTQNEKMISHVDNLEYYPDVYFIILDGYGGTISLKNDLEFDNSNFVKLLEEKGFFVVPNSHSNYPQTFLSIPSTMNMKYLNYLKDSLGEESKDQLTPMNMMENSLAMEIFKSKGYKIINFSNGSFNKINSDYLECEGKNLFEGNKLMSVLNKINMFEYFLTWIELENHRNNQECFFIELPEIHKKF